MCLCVTNICYRYYIMPYVIYYIYTHIYPHFYFSHYFWNWKNTPYMFSTSHDLYQNIYSRVYFFIFQKEKLRHRETNSNVCKVHRANQWQILNLTQAYIKLILLLTELHVFNLYSYTYTKHKCLLGRAISALACGCYFLESLSK